MVFQFFVVSLHCKNFLKMTNRESFIKRHSIAICIVSVVVFIVSCAYYYFSLGPSHIDYTKGFICMLSTMGLGELIIILAAYIFPKYFIEDYDEALDNAEPSYYFFHEDYQYGICRVIRYYGKALSGNTDLDSFSKSVNFLDKEGNLLLDDWVPFAIAVEVERAIVQLPNGLFCLFDLKNKTFLGDSYDRMSINCTDGLLKVMDGDFNVNFIDIKTGNLCWKEWRVENLHFGENE